MTKVKGIAGTALAVAALAVAVTPAGARAAQPTEDTDGLRSEAATTFVVDPGARVVRVSTEMTVTHVYDPDYYFHSYDVPVLAESVNHRAVRSDGSSLGVEVVEADDPEAEVAFAVVRLRPNLFVGDTMTFRLDYEVPFQPPRADGWSRGNDAVVTFPAFTPGDAGLARLEVRLPTGYEIEMGGEVLEKEEVDGQVVLTAEAIAEPWLFTSVIVATRDDKMLSRETEIDERTVTLRAWPDDAAWIDYVEGQLKAQMPVLEDLVGQPWPDEAGELDVIESSTPAAHGYAGWIDLGSGEITLGDAFDPATIAHELAHVWFNENLFEGRWINEGLADEYAETALAQLATPGFAPAGEPAPDPAGAGAVALNDWTDTFSFEDVDHERERYAYLTSWHVMDQIADEIGVEGLRAVVGAAADRSIAYPGDPTGERNTGKITWRVLLDLLENEAGSTRADGLFVRFVANPAERAEMDARRVARTQYAAFAERSGTWSPPFELRRALGTWDFEPVEELIATADGVLGVRAEIEEAVAGLDVELRGLEESYESARELDDVVDEADDTLAAARAYRDARRHHDEVAGGLVAQVGLLGTGVDAQLDDALDDLEDGQAGGSRNASERAEERLDAAVRNGVLRLAGAVLVAALLVALGVWGPMHRRRRARRRERELRQLEAMYGAPSAPDPHAPAPSPAPAAPLPPSSPPPPPPPAADPPPTGS